MHPATDPLILVLGVHTPNWAPAHESVVVAENSTGSETQVSGMAGRYANALFDLAKDAKAIDAIEKDMAGLARALHDSDDLRRMLRSPVFSAEEQAGAIEAIADKSGANDLTKNFLGLVARNRRLFALGDMAVGLRQLVAKHRGEVTAEVTSAAALDDKHIEELKKTLAASVGKDVQLTTKVDPGLLGGLVVKLGSRMIDTSIRTKLNNLKIAMKEVG